MSPPRSTRSAGCSASGSSRPLRRATPACWAGWTGSGRYAWWHRGDRQLRRRPGRHLTAAGVRVVEVDRSDRQDRRRRGKSGPLDAVSAARAAQSGRARGAPKGRDGSAGAIRALMVARRSAAGERTRTINQARALILTGPDNLRARFARHTAAALVSRIAALRPCPRLCRPHRLARAGTARSVPRRPAWPPRRVHRPPRQRTCPGLVALYGTGRHTAALLLIAAGDHPGRLRSEAAGAHLCAAAPIAASSGKVTRHRLNPGGDRQGSHAL
jgi:transposase